jgi:hypothetical protein
MRIGINPDHPARTDIIGTQGYGKYLVGESHCVPSKGFFWIPNIRRSSLPMCQGIVSVALNKPSAVGTE